MKRQKRSKEREMVRIKVKGKREMKLEKNS